MSEMLRPEPTLRFFVYTTRGLRRDLAEALVDFGEVQVERLSSIPGLSQPEDVETPNLKKFEDLRATLERIVSFVGELPSTGEEGDGVDPSRLESEVEETISEFVEILRKIELASRAKARVKELLRKKEELEKRISEIEERVSRLLAARPISEEDAARIRIARRVVELERALMEVGRYISTLSHPRMRPRDALPLIDRCEESIMLSLELIQRLLREGVDLSGIEPALAEIRDLLEGARKKSLEAVKVERELSDLRRVQELWSELVDIAKKRPEILLPGEGDEREIRRIVRSLERRMEELRREILEVARSARERFAGLREEFMRKRASVVSPKLLEIREVSPSVDELVKEAEPLLIELNKVKEEIDELEPLASKDAVEKLKECLESKRAELRGLGLAVISLMRKIRRDAAVELVESEYFLQGEQLVVSSGWIPKSRAEEFQSFLRSKLGSVAVEFERRDSKIPVKVRPPSVAAHFGILSYKYGIPGADEIDPTLVTSVVFPLFFGFMYGDLGHGLVLAAVGAILRKKFSGPLRDLGGVLLSCGISAAVFGALYGELFFIHVLEPVLPNPVMNPIGLAAAALVVGASTLMLSFVLFIANSLIRGERMKALLGFKGLPTLIMYAGVALAVARNGGDISATLRDPLFMWMAVPLMVTVIFPVVESALHGHGIVHGAVEGLITFLESTLALLSNSLSFLRLAGFAVSHAAFGVLACDLGFGAHCEASTIAHHVAEAPTGLLVLILFNVFAMALEGMLSFIQATRLTFYEFFSKFFEGRSLKFLPVREVLPAPGGE